MTYLPLASVTTVCSPLIAGLVATTSAPATGFPVEASVTTPAMTPFAAAVVSGVSCAAATPAQRRIAAGASHRRPSSFFLMTTSLENAFDAESETDTKSVFTPFPLKTSSHTCRASSHPGPGMSTGYRLLNQLVFLPRIGPSG
jgi:hypothetical protein